MKRQIFSFATAAIALALAGCGGGGGGGSTDSEITRALIAGTAGKTWRLAAIRGNANYERSGIDTPCAASLKKLSDPTLSYRCGSRDDIVMNPDGTGSAYGITSTWSLSGSTLTLNLSSLGVITTSVSIEPATVGSPQRLRLRQLSRVVNGIRNPDEDDIELVILELDIR